MGRAIIREPVAFLMDEPLSNLDAKLRVGMRASLAQLHARLSVTSIYVTHDQTEAMTLGHRVAVMRDGRIVQVDVPQRLYQAPNDLFVAAFIGSPSMNLVEATVDGDDDRVRPVPRPARPRPSSAARRRASRARHPPRGVRRCHLRPKPPPTDRRRPRRARGARLRLARLLPRRGAARHDRDARRSQTTRRRSSPRATRSSPPGSTRRRRRSVGAPLELAVDPASFHFFDVESGESLLSPVGSLADAGRQPAHEEALPG